MLDLEQTPEIPATVVTHMDGGGDDLFDKLHHELQIEKIKKLKDYFSKTPTPVSRETLAVSGAVLLHLAKCPNKPEGHDGGDPCVGINHDGSHFYRCLHKNCTGLAWKDIEQLYGPLNSDGEQKALGPRLLTCKELDAELYNIRYHIRDTLAAVQNCVIGGRQKTLKTSIAIDAAVSLASGTPFLGRLAINKPCKVVIFSGESGMSVIQETGRRVCRSKDLSLPNVDGLYWSEWLPRLDSTKHLEMLEQTIQETGCEVCFLDPCYLMMPGTDAGNLFVQGTLLGRVSEICQKHAVCPILLHHLRKRGKGDRSFDPPELDELSWAGFGEFARQWWLIGRREPYEPGTGSHRLWLSIGGSAGHSALWALDIEEGVSGEPRKWEVTMSTPSQARAEQKAETIRERIIKAASEFPGGETKTTIFAAGKLKWDSATRAVFESLVADGTLAACQVRKGSASYDGFVLKEGSHAHRS